MKTSRLLQSLAQLGTVSRKVLDVREACDTLLLAWLPLSALDLAVCVCCGMWDDASGRCNQ